MIESLFFHVKHSIEFSVPEPLHERFCFALKSTKKFIVDPGQNTKSIKSRASTLQHLEESINIISRSRVNGHIKIFAVFMQASVSFDLLNER